MASKIPLWKRMVPQHPVYWKGNPQHYLFLPQYWMKMIKPTREVPPNRVNFVVHPQMSKIDIKNYLEKIYKVPVSKVSIKVEQGKMKQHPTQKYDVFREDDRKIAYVQLAGDHTFKFPNVFEKKTNTEKEMEEFQKLRKEEQIEERKNWEKLSLPPWFR
ncbi:39S ribosomal protein L23, mitochondrial-like [Argonauta hians]